MTRGSCDKSRGVKVSSLRCGSWKELTTGVGKDRHGTWGGTEGRLDRLSRRLGWDAMRWEAMLTARLKAEPLKNFRGVTGKV